MELRIQRPEQMEADFASVLLREGESVDDCVAAFDAIKLSGGPKKALLSLGVGMFCCCYFLILLFLVLNSIILYFQFVRLSSFP